MSAILIFAGTTEGRRLAETLSDNRIACVVSVATDYGEAVMPALPYVTVHTGRMEIEEMKTFMRAEEFCAVVDATHPYATVASEHIRQSAAETDLMYLRLKRETGVRESVSGEDGSGHQYHFCQSAETCAQMLAATEGNILLTTGSKDLSIYCACQEMRERLYVRVLPGMESLMICEENGLKGKQIIAMQGPFCTEMNQAVIRQFDIRHLVTKESGAVGGFQEKLSAAEAEHIPVYIIGNPEREVPGLSYEEVCRSISQITGQKLLNHLSLVGIGMGAADSLTEKARREIVQADYLFGAKRLLSVLDTNATCSPIYTAEDILPCLEELSGAGARIVVLFSGDTGFYSGCAGLYEAVQERTDCVTRICPGISSISSMAAATGIAWQDAQIMSIHGHGTEEDWKTDFLDRIRHSAKTFLLVSGAKDVRLIGEQLSGVEFAACRIVIGYQISYPEEKLLTLTPEECLHVSSEGLYSCLILNASAKPRDVSCRIRDNQMTRGQTPMTKEEIRELSVCKLELNEDSIVYDIGSGTGSIAVAMAMRSPKICVYAVEEKEAALELIRANKTQFGLFNIQEIQGRAPLALEALPVPTHAFIGGSGGQLQEILSLLYQKNSEMRIVTNAVSLETVKEMTELRRDDRIEDFELIQVQVNRVKEFGDHQLMQAENPVFICSFQFVGK